MNTITQFRVLNAARCTCIHRALAPRLAILTKDAAYTLLNFVDYATAGSRKTRGAIVDANVEISGSSLRVLTTFTSILIRAISKLCSVG